FCLLTLVESDLLIAERPKAKLIRINSDPKNLMVPREDIDVALVSSAQPALEGLAHRLLTSETL
ncbi:MAG TPA: hypothetical protein V6D20_22595, partial [Candidatus Obscuribacterales bacterium]